MQAYLIVTGLMFAYSGFVNSHRDLKYSAASSVFASAVVVWAVYLLLRG